MVLAETLISFALHLIFHRSDIAAKLYAKSSAIQLGKADQLESMQSSTYKFLSVKVMFRYVG